MAIECNQKAPDFELLSDSGDRVSLSQFRGKPVILYFYPKDNTSGCTAEACDFRDALPQFDTKNAVVLGVSKDSMKSHLSFKNKLSLPFSLLSDPDGQVCNLYGVWVEKSMYGRKYFGIERATFLINAEGYIQAVWRKVKVPGHVDAVLKEISSC